MPGKTRNPFRCFNSSPEVIRTAVMLYVRYPLSLPNVEDLLAERGIEISHETVRFWWNRFGPMFAAEIKAQRRSCMRGFRQWKWHLDEMYVKVNGKLRYLWRAVDHEGEILESYVTKERDRAAALAFIKKALKNFGSPEAIVSDDLRSYGGRHGRTRKCRRTGRRPAPQHPSGELALTSPTTRAGDAAVPKDGIASEVRLRPCERPQPFQRRTPPRRQPHLQDPPLRRPDGVGEPHGLSISRGGVRCVKQRQVVISLTAPGEAVVEVC